MRKSKFTYPKCPYCKKEYQDGFMEYGLMNLVTQGWCEEVKVKCHNCGKEFIADDQIKWADCLLRYYTVGDKICADNGDGEYTYGSYVRPSLDTQCPHCKAWQHFKAIVKNNILEKLETTEIFEQKVTKNIDFFWRIN